MIPIPDLVLKYFHIPRSIHSINSVPIYAPIIIISRIRRITVGNREWRIARQHQMAHKMQKYRQREIEPEDKARKHREELLNRTPIPPSRIAEPVEAPPAIPVAFAVVAGAPTPASGPGKYVPRYIREVTTTTASSPTVAPPATDKWSAGGSRMDARGSDM